MLYHFVVKNIEEVKNGISYSKAMTESCIIKAATENVNIASSI